MTIITIHVSCCLSLLLTAKNFFRVSDRTGGQLHSHCFQASDAFNKQQWINCIRQAKEAAALTGDQPPQTGQCLGGQIGSLGETGLSLRGDSGLEDEKGETRGEMETGLGSKGEAGDKDPGLGKDAGVSLTGGEMETGLGVDGETGLELGGETGMDGEARQTVSETETGEMETGQDGEICVEPGAREGWKMDNGGGGGGGGETLSGVAVDGPASPPSSASPCREEQEREVMDEVEEVVMDTGEVDSLRC